MQLCDLCKFNYRATSSESRMIEYGKLFPEDNPDSDVDPCSYCDEEYRCNFKLDCGKCDAVRNYIKAERDSIDETLEHNPELGMMHEDVYRTMDAIFKQIETLLDG